MAPIPPATAGAPFYDSLDELIQASTSLPSPDAKSRIEYIPRDRDRKKSRLLVCHDFKGGYCERADVRGYTFQFWDVCDVFVYFSHHRVTVPPQAWITAAHRFGTKMLGVLIFEWDAGSLDLRKLNRGHADKLVELCLERGFEGWLVNVEVDGIGAPEAERVRDWLAYLKRETERKVSGGEVLWYDAVTTEGKLQWQSAVTTLNAPFFTSSHGIFTDYHWTPSALQHTVSHLSAHLPYQNLSQVFVGIDVFGRGQFGGGQMDSSTAFRAIRSASPQLSVALFAPGWTAESDILQHDLSTRSGWQKWWEDERFLWEGGDSSSRILASRKHARAFERVGVLAHSLAVSQPINPPPLAPFHYDDPLSPISPLCSYFDSIAALTPRPGAQSFFTDFSVGSGSGFYHHGEAVWGPERGWTQVNHCTSRINLLSPEKATMRRREEDAFMGGGCIGLTFRRAGDQPLCKVGLKAVVGEVWKGSVVYKASKGSIAPVLMTVGVTSGGVPKRESIVDEQLQQGWRRSSTTFTFSDSAIVDSIGISVDEAHLGQELLVDSIHFIPVNRFIAPHSVANLHLDVNQVPHRLRWDAEDPSYVYFTVWQGGSLLGWTSERYFDVPLGTGESRITWRVIGILASGEEVECNI